MTLAQLNEATALALSRADLSAVDDRIFSGFGLPEYPIVYVTVAQVAKLLRWQAVQFNGQLNAEAYNEVARIGRHKFMIGGAA